LGGIPLCGSGAEPADDQPVNWVFEATNHLGQWIWETNTFDKQTVRFWKSFQVPAGSKITNANLRLTVDNGYTLFLDGQEIGRGSDWRTVTEYDVIQLLSAGRHVVAVEGFNDRLEGGLIFVLELGLADGRSLEIPSDNSWFIAPVAEKSWMANKAPLPGWHQVKVIGSIHHHPWENLPMGLATVPASRPLVVHFWQRGGFQLALSAVCVCALGFCFWLMTRLAAQGKAQKFLQVERARIARDIHDDLGAQLTQLVLLGEIGQREPAQNAKSRGQFAQICERARALARALDDVVWAVNSRRDTVRDFTSYVCRYAQLFLGATPLRCRLDVEPEIPATAFDLPVRRNLFLAVKEALNNAAKHSQADELFLRIHRHDQKLSVAVEDNGRGFDPAEAGGERNGLANMAQRMNEVGGTCDISSQPGGGCLVVFTVPLPPRRGWFRRAEPGETAAHKMDQAGS
jgi:signal transduction histidine kinase